ncbi:MAG: hypothetical protein AAF483_03920 [Planctomycetota bacterium]
MLKSLSKKKNPETTSRSTIFNPLRQGSRSCLGMDIGQFETKLVWVKKTPSGFQAASAKMLSFPPEELVDASETENLAEERRGLSVRNPFRAQLKADHDKDNLWNLEEVPKLVQRLACSLSPQIAASDVAVNLSMAACDIRGICLPDSERITDSAIQQAIQEATGDSSPSSYALLPNPKADSTKQRTFCIPSEATLLIASALETNKLSPWKIDGLPWCKLRLLKMMNDLPKNHFLPILDWSFGNPTLTLIAENKIKYVRHLNVGGMQAVLAGAERGFGMDLPQAVRWLELCFESEFDADPCALEMRHWAIQCCQQIVAEIEVAMDFVRWQFRDTEISRLMVVGGGGALPGLCRALQSELAIKVEPWSLKLADLELTSEFAVATSLALSGVGNDRR